MNVYQFFSQPLTLSIPSVLIDSHPSDDTPILSVIPPTTAATTREQHYSSEHHSATGPDWSAAATGDTYSSTAHF